MAILDTGDQMRNNNDHPLSADGSVFGSNSSGASYMPPLSIRAK